MRDEAEIRGHRRTYVGAMPGRILQTLRRIESNNPVILLDELDKIGSDFRGDPASALLEVLDPAQNHTFTDHYLDLPFDLSRVLFIATANWLEPIHAALRDRLEVIELPSYTESEKLQIAKRYLVPRQLEEHGLAKKEFALPDPTLRRLIQEYTREAGVRQLERQIAALARKAARKLVSKNGKTGPIKLEPGALKTELGHAPFLNETAERINEFGIATGLAWTPVGGEVLFIEVSRMPGKGGFLLTGSLGDVMKESAQTAFSYLRSQADKLGLDLNDASKHDIHIHVPAGATPKDGPSAGVAIVAALASLLAQRRVRSDTAMTGEISLRGPRPARRRREGKGAGRRPIWCETRHSAETQRTGLAGNPRRSARARSKSISSARFPKSSKPRSLRNELLRFNSALAAPPPAARPVGSLAGFAFISPGNACRQLCRWPGSLR
jgi:ATP-dependent Lon protease